MGCELSILNVWLISGASRRSRWFRPKRTASAASVVTLKASSLFTAPHVQDVLVCLLFRSSILMDRDAKKQKTLRLLFSAGESDPLSLLTLLKHNSPLQQPQNTQSFCLIPF